MYVKLSLTLPDVLSWRYHLGSSDGEHDSAKDDWCPWLANSTIESGEYDIMTTNIQNIGPGHVLI
jgi:hypothetical protein